MKSRYLIIFAGILTVIAGWWLLHPPISAPTTTPAATISLTPAPVVVNAPALASKPTTAPQVAAPKVVPAAPPAQSVAVVTVDNQKELSTAIAELVHYVQAGDLVTAWQTYAQPEHFAEIPLERRAQVDDHLRAAATNPQIQMRVQILSQVLDSFSTQTPAYNDTGDMAAFQVSGPAAAVGLKAVHFQKVEGRWYLANDDLDNIGRLLGL